jgi:hypothetical protein
VIAAGCIPASPGNRAAARSWPPAGEYTSWIVHQAELDQGPDEPGAAVGDDLAAGLLPLTVTSMS